MKQLMLAGVVIGAALGAAAIAQQRPDKSNMELVGYDELQGRSAYQPSETMLAQLGLARRDIGEKNFYYGKGCDACNQTGYKGRKGIYELMKITDPLRELINERAPSVTLKAKAIELGMVTLRQDGLRSIFAGDTTIEEVLKYT